MVGGTADGLPAGGLPDDGPRVDDLEHLASAGTWTVDLGSGRPWWSAGQHRLHGTEPGDVETIAAWQARIHPDDAAMWKSAIDRAIRTRSGYAVDHRIVRADDGTVRWLRCRCRVAGDHLRGVSLDTSDEHAATESIRTFLADAAHELRTPAAAIGQAVSALAVIDDEHRDEVVAVLRRQAERLRRLTTDLVDLAQLEAGPMAIVFERVPLATAAADALQHAPPPPGHSVRIDVPDDLAVLATAGYLDRVLVNLLTNAYRYGGPHVTIRARAIDGGRVTLEVADDGPGVPDDAVPELFHAFRRGPQRHPEASGLGLAIVSRLVHRFGGDVTYRPGEPGAAFVVELERG